ncbi:MAG: hypothetical protein ACO1O6_01130 [Bacteroidota bacterium]
MKKMNLLTLSVFMLLFMFSCKKPVTEVNTDFVGNWSGSDSEAGYTINIQSDSQASYLKLKGASQVNVTGKAKIKGDKLKIFTKKFHIDQFPTRQDPVSWTEEVEYLMVLDGIEFSCWK